MTLKIENRLLAAITSLTLLSGCASVTHNSAQIIQVETKLANGEAVDGANCSLSNEEKTYEITTPGSLEIDRSGTDLEVTCKHPGFPDAKASVVSRANAGMYGNIILGGVIGAVIDHNTGKAYNYPTWLQLVMGKILRFDRLDEASGKPSVGIPMGDTTEVTAIQAKETAIQAKVTMDDLKDLMPAAK